MKWWTLGGLLVACGCGAWITRPRRPRVQLPDELLIEAKRAAYGSAVEDARRRAAFAVPRSRGVA